MFSHGIGWAVQPAATILDPWIGGSLAFPAVGVKFHTSRLISIRVTIRVPILEHSPNTRPEPECPAYPEILELYDQGADLCRMATRLPEQYTNGRRWQA